VEQPRQRPLILIVLAMTLASASGELSKSYSDNYRLLYYQWLSIGPGLASPESPLARDPGAQNGTNFQVFADSIAD
jgi:hypothetical protein